MTSKLTNLAVALPGMIFDYAGSTAPTGFLLCYGQAVSRTTYAQLFDIIGSTFGAGDGSTTFNVPDLRGRVLAGKDDMGGTAASRLTIALAGFDGTILGAAGGAQTVSLATANLPSHSHNVFLNDPGHAHSTSAIYFTGANNISGGSTANLNIQALASNTASTGITVRDTAGGAGTANQTAATGSGTAHLNTQPTMVINKIIAT